MVPTSPELGDTGEKAKSVVSCAPRQEATSTTRKTDDWWTWELFGVMVSAVAIVGIVILLHIFDGKPEPSWSYTFHGHVALLQDKAAHVSFNAHPKHHRKNSPNDSHHQGPCSAQIGMVCGEGESSHRLD